MIGEKMAVKENEAFVCNIVLGLGGSSFGKNAKMALTVKFRGVTLGVKLIFAFIKCNFWIKLPMQLVLFLEIFKWFKNFYLDEVLPFYNF